MLIFLATLFTLASPACSHAEWKYESENGREGTLALTLVGREKSEYVTVKQFCFALSCKALYQWSSQRVFVSNPENKKSAMISPLAKVALVDGRVVRVRDRVLSNAKDGYMIPMDLARKLVSLLKLGELEHTEDEKMPVRDAEEQFALKTIVIDPGHGGNDFGTKVGDIFEKDVALIYALKFKHELERVMPEVEVHLTRIEDRYVSLPDRAKFANSKDATLFISIHVNHAEDRNVQGQETYILSPDATDDEARRIALMENETWIKGSKLGKAHENMKNDVKKILVDMEQTKYIQSSAKAASMIAQELGTLEQTHGLKSRGVKQAMFYVLSQVAMPSTLIEMGFLSNTGDRGRMMDIKFRDEFVLKLVSAVKRYKAAL